MRKIYVDGLSLVEGHFSGVGQYTLGILRGMDSLLEDACNEQLEHPEVTVIIPRNTVDKFKSYNFKHVGYKKFPLSFRYMSALWHRNWLPPIDLWCGKGLYIFPRFVDMRLLFSRSIVVIHDLTYELYRDYTDEGNAIFLSKHSKHSVKRASVVVVVSENTKKDVMEFYKLNDKEMVVTPNATDYELFYRRSESEIRKVKDRYGVKKDYILALSNLEPRKNLDMLVDAYCSLPSHYREKVSLLLVGVTGWKTDKLFKKILGKVEEGYDIIRPTSYVSDQDKPAIISGAKMLVYPSHYEGFGIPPLEALACGVPVITANNSSLPEVVGNVGKMISSKDQDELRVTMEDYLENITEITNQVRIDGPRQAERFSWISSAKAFFNAAERIQK
jgi:alpha-1,3-rhamnosyl/mannosyltransferase